METQVNYGNNLNLELTLIYQQEVLNQILKLLRSTVNTLHVVFMT